jgi:hypothetical protein
VDGPDPAAEVALVGRADELHLLAQWWRGVCVPAVSPLAVIVGESGVGKSRLVAEFAGDVAASGGSMLMGAATDHGFLPYQPWVTALRSFMLTATVSERELAIGDRAAEFAAIPWLRDLVSDEPRASLGLPDQTAVTRVVAGVLARLASTKPTLVVLEDMHWSDRGSINVLREVVGEAMPNVGIVVVERRPRASAGPWAESLDAFRSRWELPVSRLDRASCRALLTDVVPGPVSEELIDAVHDASGGNPFIALSLADLAARSSMGFELWASQMPQSATAIWSARFAPLQSEVREVLSLAAVVGTVFDPDLVARASGRSAPADTAFHDAVAAGLVIPAEAGSLRFAHALLREHLYGGLTATRRRRLHRAVARALSAEESRGPSARSAQRAHHWRASGPSGLRETLTHSIAASAWALAQGASDEARVLGDRALALVEELSADGQLPESELASHRVDLASVLLRIGHPAGVGLMRDAADHFDSQHDVETLARIADPLLRAGQSMGMPEAGTELAEQLIPHLDAVDPRLHSRILARLSRALEGRVGAEPMESVLSAAALRLARQTADPETLAIALFCHVVDEPWTDKRLDQTLELVELGRTHGNMEWVVLGQYLAGTMLLDRGDVERAVVLTQELEAVESSVPHGYIGTIRNADLAKEARVVTVSRKVALAQWRGEFAEQGRLIGELFASLDHPALELDRLLAVITTQQGLLAFDRGEFEDFVELVIAYAEDRPETTQRQICAAFVMAETGRSEAAYAIYRRVVDSNLELVTVDQTMSFMLNLMGRMSFMFEDRAGAALIERSLGRFTGRSSSFLGGSMGPVDTALAYCAACQGHQGRAESLLAAARDQAERWRAPPAMARTHLADAEIALRAGRPAQQVISAARAAIAVAEPIGMEGAVRTARSLLSGSGAPARPVESS